MYRHVARNRHQPLSFSPAKMLCVTSSSCPANIFECLPPHHYWQAIAKPRRQRISWVRCQISTRTIYITHDVSRPWCFLSTRSERRNSCYWQQESFSLCHSQRPSSTATAHLASPIRSGKARRGYPFEDALAWNQSDINVIDFQTCTGPTSQAIAQRLLPAPPLASWSKTNCDINKSWRSHRLHITTLIDALTTSGHTASYSFLYIYLFCTWPKLIP